MVQTPRGLHLKPIEWRDTAYSYDTVPKVYLPDCLSLPWDLIDRLYLLTVLMPSRAVGRWAFNETVHMTDRVSLKEGWINATWLVWTKEKPRKTKVLPVL